MSNTGRPTKYEESYDELAYNYCLLGAIDSDLSEFFDVSESTINKWKLDFPSFSESIKKGKVQADAKVASSLFHRANGYSHKETKIATHEGRISDTLDVEKHYAPDPTAAIFWLKNRQPKLWRDKQDINHQSEDGSMTPKGFNDFYNDKTEPESES